MIAGRRMAGRAVRGTVVAAKLLALVALYGIAVVLRAIWKAA